VAAMADRLQLLPRGPFSLQAAAGLAFGPTEGRPPAFDGAMRLAFGLDGGRGYVGAVLRQPDQDGPVSVELQGTGATEPDTAMRQIARIVSLDHDGEQFTAIGARDPVIGELQRALPGQRPVLFHSPYEGAAWSIISARRPAAQAARVRHAIAEQFGATFELANTTLHAFPQPDALRRLPADTPGLTEEKVLRLRAVADAALAGQLDVEHLHALGPDQAWIELQRLKGLGPFYAGLVVLRASGFADAMLPMTEPKVLARAAERYGLEQPPTLERFTEMAEVWRPFRTWCTVLIRLGGDRAAGAAGRGT
jgi:DNA-3-methyladenine glycosylase II